MFQFFFKKSEFFSVSVLFNDSKRFQNSTAAIKWAQVEEKLTNQPDTAMLSLVEFLATFLLAYYLKKIRMSIYFGRTVLHTKLWFTFCVIFILLFGF